MKSNWQQYFTQLRIEITVKINKPKSNSKAFLDFFTIRPGQRSAPCPIILLIFSIGETERLFHSFYNYQKMKKVVIHISLLFTAENAEVTEKNRIPKKPRRVVKKCHSMN